MHGCMDAWMHGCMDAWMHVCKDVLALAIGVIKIRFHCVQLLTMNFHLIFSADIESFRFAAMYETRNK